MGAPPVLVSAIGNSISFISTGAGTGVVCSDTSGVGGRTLGAGLGGGVGIGVHVNVASDGWRECRFSGGGVRGAQRCGVCNE